MPRLRPAESALIWALAGFGAGTLLMLLIFVSS